jgi:DNA-binding IclR family transcriptional regulator
MSEAYSVPSVKRALDILELLAQSRRGLTLSAISRKLGLPKSSVHLLVKTLEATGYLRMNRLSGNYHFGLKIVTLSYTALENLELRELARPFLQDLMLRTGLTIHMAILEQAEAVIIEKVEAPGMLRLATWVGRRLDANSSGVGKALLAFAPESTTGQRYTAMPMVKHNRNTITSPEKLNRELSKVRELGFAFEDQEGEIGFRCIGVPIYGSANGVIAAISVAGTTCQIPTERVRKLAAMVRSTALEISALSGYKADSKTTSMNN